MAEGHQKFKNRNVIAVGRGCSVTKY